MDNPGIGYLTPATIRNRDLAEMVNVLGFLGRQDWSKWTFLEACANVKAEYTRRGRSDSEAEALTNATIKAFLASKGE